MSIQPPRRVKVCQVDAFTRTRFSGNPAGVVLEADGLDEGWMQRIARELNNSETAFVLRPEGPGHDVRLRFFTPTAEVPSCGHATIAAHFARAMEYGLREEALTQLTGAGPMPIRISTEDGAIRVSMTQGAVILEPPLPQPLVDRTVLALGLEASDLAPHLPVQVASTGHSKVMVPLKSREVLDTLAPDLPALARLSGELGCNGYFAFTFDRPDPGALIQARMFAPAIGIAEDPVTGNGHGPLGAYLVHHRAVAHDGRAWSFRGAQGDRTGRSGWVDVRVELEAGRPFRVSITGDAVLVFRTELEL